MIEQVSENYDIIVVGAGPAGMSAAMAAAEAGASVLLLDDQPAPGGQIYRGILSASKERMKILGASYRDGLKLTQSLLASTVNYRPRATVWQFDEEGSVIFSINGQVHQASAKHIILATGALERPMPIPGWTLPGVMTAGAAQILLKSSSLVPEETVLAGSGPLLYLLASQLIKAGAAPKAIVETQSTQDFFAATRFFPRPGVGWREIFKGLMMLHEIKKAGVPRFNAATNLSAEGTEAVQALTFTAKGDQHRIECSTLLLHQGVVPNTQITRSLRLEHKWNKRQTSFQALSNGVGQTTNLNYSVVGDGRMIGGAKVAALEGRCAGAFVASSFGYQVEPTEVFKLQKQIKKHRAVRSFLDRLYQPPEELLSPADDTIVCRCEAVTAGQIRSYAANGCFGPNQTKAFGRSGMGPCQGRYCALTVTEILAKENSLSQQEVGSYRIRSPIKPITLGEMAQLHKD